MTQTSPPESGEGHVVIVGAGMTGLVFGRVVAEYADRVSILDHDALPEGPEFRRGAGQMAQTHFMLERGRELYEDWFPGLVDECSGPKTGPSDHGRDFHWHQYGTWKPRVETGVEIWPLDRGSLEWAVRQRVRSLPDVDIVPHRKAVGFLWDDDERIEGVRLETDDGEENWPAELVVDASGRGTRTPRLLQQSGLGPPPEQSYAPGVSYTTVDVSPPRESIGDWRGILLMPDTFESKKLGVTYPIDDDRFRVTLGAWCGESVPMSESGYVEFARDLASPALADVLDEVEFRNEPRRYQIPECTFRRYDQMNNRPAGLVVAGDAYCGLNPIYGQGMTIAAREAKLLDELLADAEDDLADSRTLDAYHDRAASFISESWMMSSAHDHQFAEIESDLTAPTYAGPLIVTLQKAAGEDPDVFRTLIRMMHMKETPSALLRPGIGLQLAKTGLQGLWTDGP